MTKNGNAVRALFVYQEAKAAYMENVENVTIATITNYFNLLLAEDNLDICNQNLLNANKLLMT